MQYRLLLLDIDGTLRPYPCEKVPEENVRAIQAVQRRGVKVAIATGRGRHAVSDEMLNGIRPDYWLCSAGALLLDSHDRELFRNPMPLELVRKAHDFCEEHNYPLFMNYADGNFIHVGYDAFLAGGEDRLKFKSARYEPDGQRYLREAPFSCFAWMPQEMEAEFHRRYPDSGAAFYFYRGRFCDIMQSRVTKASGLEQLLAILGIAREESAFVGDGENDIPLLHYAGISFCMADGQEAAKAAARHICPASMDCGVAAVCRMLWSDAFD